MAIVVVSDASPIRALAHLELLALCRDLYGSVVVPEAVQEELRQPTTTCRALEITDYGWVEVRRPQTNPHDLGVPTDLDKGEIDAIGLALELHADLVLIDERKATQAARNLGLTTIGVLGVLLEAKRSNLLNHIMPCVDRLIAEQGFFVSRTVRERIAQLAGE